MNEEVFDIAIVGSGPIGAISAYKLTEQNPDLKILLITQDPFEDNEHQSTYLYAGGSICWYRPDAPEKAKVIERTADFIKDIMQKGVDLAALEDNYIFMHRGAFVPALNLSGKKLVTYLIEQSQSRGLNYQESTILETLKPAGEVYTLKTNKGEYKTKKVLLALGVNAKKFMPNVPIEVEKRQLFILDLPVDDARKDFPHVVLPFKEGMVYLFVKKIDGNLKMVFGQEDIVEHSEEPKGEDYFQELLQMGVGDIMPFLKDAKVEKILWGYDAINKTPEVYTEDNKLFAAYCGSAVRSLIGCADAVVEKLA